jgi:hypothetical protein
MNARRRAWIGALAAVVGAVLLATAARRHEPERQAAPGAALYGQAVHEALLGLQGKETAPQPEGTWCAKCQKVHPPAAAQAAGDHMHPAVGDDVYWCDRCKAYHRRQAQPAPSP